MDLDDPDSGISLDRSNYPQNTGVVITIDDQALNVDPTSTDTWTFTTDNGQQHYGEITQLTAVQAQVVVREGLIAEARERMSDAIDNAKFDSTHGSKDAKGQH